MCFRNAPQAATPPLDAPRSCGVADAPPRRSDPREANRGSTLRYTGGVRQTHVEMPAAYGRGSGVPGHTVNKPPRAARRAPVLRSEATRARAFAGVACAHAGGAGRRSAGYTEGGSNCRWEVGGDCAIGPQRPRPIELPPGPFPNAALDSGLPAELMMAAVSLSADDTNGDGRLSCQGTCWVDTGQWIGNCN